MAEAIADALVDDAPEADALDGDDAVKSHPVVVVEAGTGTGKSFAYLTPILAADAKAVVATATIALQSQLLANDIPLVARGLGRSVHAAVLKGRSNYLCRQRLVELTEAGQREQLELLGGQRPERQLRRVLEWAAVTETGDREELDFHPAPEVWASVTVGIDECPGAARCPSGQICFSEEARADAMAADVIVTNHHYYGLDLATGGALLPEHDVVVFDEAHQLPEVLGATCGTELGGGRLRAMAARARSALTDDTVALGLDRSAMELDAGLGPMVGQAIDIDAQLVDVLVLARDRVDTMISTLRKVESTDNPTTMAKVERNMLAATRLVGDIDAVIAADNDRRTGTAVLWVDGRSDAPVLKRTPLELGSMLDKELWKVRTAILTSATLADAVPLQLGLDPSTEIIRVGSPFDYEHQALLYCPTDLPPPANPKFRTAVQDEIIGLATAAGGRTLALFTSFRAMTEATERLRQDTDFVVLAQGEGSKSNLIEQFKNQPRVILAATLSFWQGVDLPGTDLTLVTIDRLPFPRPDEPVNQARRDRAGVQAFRVVDLPRAQTLLAQAAGRLIRRGDDRGVVAVLDSRLANSRGYRWDLINALPPFRRTKDRHEVYEFLRRLDHEAAGRGDGLDRHGTED
jgi:ATP-dependent DNA helicase DinG